MKHMSNLCYFKLQNSRIQLCKLEDLKLISINYHCKGPKRKILGVNSSLFKKAVIFLNQKFEGPKSM